jgi:hypothetical protein
LAAGFALAGFEADLMAFFLGEAFFDAVFAVVFLPAFGATFA